MPSSWILSKKVQLSLKMCKFYINIRTKILDNIAVYVALILAKSVAKKEKKVAKSVMVIRNIDSIPIPHPDPKLNRKFYSSALIWPRQGLNPGSQIATP